MRECLSLALVHYPTVDRAGRVVATAVTTLDLHDLARLSRTYGLGRFFAVTPLEAQQALVARLLGHWVGGPGGRFNPYRQAALELVSVVTDLAAARDALATQWGRQPAVVATSARDGEGRVGFGEARRRLAEGRPTLLVLGTGWGLAPEALEQCDWTLAPVLGAGAYNHLSVRSAASILVDRLVAER